MGTFFSDRAERFLGHLGDEVQRLGVGVAELRVEDDPEHPRSLGKVFTVSAANPRSAALHGAIWDDGETTFISYVVGRATSGEVVLPASRRRSRASEERFLRMCRGLFACASREVVTYGAAGRVLRAWLTIEQPCGRALRVGGFQLLWHLFPGKRTESYRYEPYVQLAGDV